MGEWDRRERRKPPIDSGNRLILEVPQGGNLDKLVRLLVEAIAQGGSVQFPDLGFINTKLDLTLGLLEGENGVISTINILNGKVETFMATQEERLQAILVAVQNVKQMLADLKVNNPAIEDEITAIEAELAPATEPPTGGTEPTP